ncbi:MAG: M20/M25/M40 family metallo-hydrolase [Arenimonas sp.]|nr:M20/M25/M40 family metallo-hydrolase [Arenimonas sp.]
MPRIKALVVSLLLAGFTSGVSAQTPRADQLAFRELYQELVETNTTLSSGSCTQAAAQIGARLKAAGYSDSQLTYFSVAEHPKDGGIVAILPGSDATARPILLLAHIDVVEANREDWTRDPFKLIEENGYFYARGSSDDKAQAAIWADAMINFKKSDYKPRRTIKMALTCGEETGGAFNGAEWLSTNRRELIDAEFALNEGGGGVLDANGKPEFLSLNVGEKIYQDYNLVVTNAGGHSSRPVKPNAIYQLSAAMERIGDYEFPVHLNDTTKAMLTALSKTTKGPASAAMKSLVANPKDAQAAALLSQDPTMHSMMRTTCVATMFEAGHARNALPQRAQANVNCRIAPGETIQQVQAVLTKVVADPAVAVSIMPPDATVSVAVPLTAAILDPATALGNKMFPGVPMVPTMSTGATDGRFLGSVGIPTYGIPGIFYDADYGHIHGLNEQIRVKSVYEGRDYMVELVKLYADSK